MSAVHFDKNSSVMFEFLDTRRSVKFVNSDRTLSETKAESEMSSFVRFVRREKFLMHEFPARLTEVK